MIVKSILISTKKALGLDADNLDFDQEIMMHINGVFSTLNQIGIGPINGFEIEDEEETWDNYLNADARLNFVKQFMYLNVRLMFDPPSVSSVAASMQSKIDELTWRINLVYENDTRPLTAPNHGGTSGSSTNPGPVEVVYDDVIFNNATFTGGVISGGRP